MADKNDASRQVNEETMSKSQYAVTKFIEGLHCSQAVLEAFAKDYGIDIATSRKISFPLAGGSSMNGECGAVTGAYLVLGLEYGTPDLGNFETFQLVFDKVRLFSDEFKKLHGNLNCQQLIGLDVFTEEGINEFREKEIKKNQCANYVEASVKILEKLMQDKHI